MWSSAWTATATAALAPRPLEPNVSSRLRQLSSGGLYEGLLRGLVSSGDGIQLRRRRTVAYRNRFGFARVSLEGAPQQRPDVADGSAEGSGMHDAGAIVLPIFDEADA